MPTKPELPHDLDPEELNAMIHDLGVEMGVPHDIYSPELVQLVEIPGHIYGYNRGCRPDGLEMYRSGQKWRRRLLAELKQRREWVAQWREPQALNRRLREFCEQKGLQFKPWECPPWHAPDDMPERDSDQMHLYAGSVRLAVELRRQLLAEIEAADG
jgi:hypothetical protein